MELANAKVLLPTTGLRFFDVYGHYGRPKRYHAVILAVNHAEFNNLDWKSICHEKAVVYDVKGGLDKSLITARL